MFQLLIIFNRIDHNLYHIFHCHFSLLTLKRHDISEDETNIHLLEN